MGKEYDDRKKKRRGGNREEHRERKRAIASLGYSNEVNPFQDPNLSKPFTWKKKTSTPSSSRDDNYKEELLKVRQYRTSREEDKKEYLRMKEDAARARNAIDLTAEAQHESTFELVQRLLKSRVRLSESRPTDFDLLIKNGFIYSPTDYSLSSIKCTAGAVAQEYESHLQDQIDPTVIDPLELLSTLSQKALLALQKDVSSFQQELENNYVTLEYWKWISVVLQDKLKSSSSTTTIIPEVQEEMNSLLQGKSLEELETMQQEVNETLNDDDGASGIDIEYWEDVANAIRVSIASTKLKSCVTEWKALNLPKKTIGKPLKTTSTTTTTKSSLVSDSSKAAIAMQRNEEQKGMDEEEEEFINEVAVVASKSSSTSTTTNQSFVPRKPRYYNRVKSGYEWHKYNQTHYDQDNPPPKVVQGYKFNLFYPDLIDKHVTPTFLIEPADTKDFCILRFRAGPPYQDIAFKIVNQQWDYGQKNGYKSVFERGILHLYFNFKRHRYRR